MATQTGAAADVENAIAVQLDRLLDKGVSAEEVMRAQNQLLAAAIYAQDSLQSGPRIYGNALGVGGTIAFVIGSVMLIDTDVPGFGIPKGLIAAAAVMNALFVIAVLRMAHKARKRPVVSGSEELIGASGEVLEVSSNVSWVRVHSERWRAASDIPLHPGQRVHVTGREGLVLKVEPDLAGPRDARGPEVPAGAKNP